MRSIRILWLLSIALYSCHTKQPPAINGLLNEQNLLSQFFDINTNNDTTLLTKNGCVIRIPKNAIAGSSTVKLEIKEALSNTDMVLAGLSTMSGKQALSSGGMIYFNAASGYNIEIKKSIEVLVPAKNYNRDMQVFKGDTVNGKINWQQPEALPQDSTTAKVDAGRRLFSGNCASCHKVYEDFTGPALYGITERLPWEWVYTLTVHDTRILEGGCMEGGENALWHTIADTSHLKYWRTDANAHNENKIPETVKACLYHKCLRKKFGAEMTIFAALKETDVENIYAYIKSESDKRPDLKTRFARTCCDSCVEYTEANLGLLAQREKLKNDNATFFTLERVIPIPPAAATNYVPDTSNTQPPVAKVSPVSVKGTYYTINIKATGWYNIDLLMKEYNNCVQSELFVRLQGSYDIDVNINLIIPQYKAFVEGGKLQDGKQYGFDNMDGTIKLPQNVKAYIIAFAEKGDKLIFAKKEFNTQTRQTIELAFTEISREALKDRIVALKLDNVDAAVTDSKHAGEIRAIDKQLQDAEKLKPVNCNCDLLAPWPATAATDSLKK